MLLARHRIDLTYGDDALRVYGHNDVGASCVLLVEKVRALLLVFLCVTLAESTNARFVLTRVLKHANRSIRRIKVDQERAIVDFFDHIKDLPRSIIPLGGALIY